MPIPNEIIAGGLSGLAGFGQSLIQANVNKKNEAFTREMYERQRKDSLADWSMMNEYNSPTAQMERFKQAGLNPNLIYGQQNTSVMARGASSGQPSREAPNVAAIASNALSAYMDVRIKEQQLDNLKQENARIIADTALKSVNTDKTDFFLGIDKSLKDSIIYGRQATNDIIGWNRDILQNTAPVKIDMAKQNLEQIIETVAKIKADRSKSVAERDRIMQSIDNLKKDGTLKQLEINLRNNGVNPNGKIWERVIGLILHNLGLSLAD